MSNLISIGALSLPSYISSQKAIGCTAMAGAAPLICYISIWFSLPSVADLTLRFPGQVGPRPPYLSSSWLATITTLSITASIERYLVAIFYVSVIIPKYYDFTFPTGAVEVVLALALLELYIIICIVVGLWEANQTFQKMQLKNEWKPLMFNPPAANRDSLAECV